MTDAFYKELQLDFYNESLDLIERFESVLLGTEEPNQEQLNELFRIAHTIKGGSSAVGLDLIASYTHKVEDFLTGFKKNTIPYSPRATTILLEFADILRNEFKSKIENEENEWNTDDNLNQIQIYNPIMDATESKTHSTEKISLSSDKKSLKKSANSQVKVENERLDSIFNTIGEVVILKNQLQEYFSKFDDLQTSHLSESLSFLVKDLYDKALGLRLTTIRPLFQKLQRTMRDLSTQLNKNVNLILLGDETEIDRSFSDILSEPLIHLVRNAIDHGIENSEVRKLNNKSEYATVELKAYHQAGQIVIEIKDDGYGINCEKVFNKAKSQNLIPENSKMSDYTLEQIHRFIFLPGFSTAEKLTDVSGRGVGLDVVKSAIEKVHGKVSIESKLHEGTSFKLFLPMTTSLVDGVIFGLSQQRYIVPARSINTILNINMSQIYFDPERKPYYLHQGHPIQIVDLRMYFNCIEKNEKDLILIISEDKGIQFGCLFDRVYGQVQTVVKPTPEVHKKSEFLGVSVLGDGFTCLILDIISIKNNYELNTYKYNETQTLRVAN